MAISLSEGSDDVLQVEDICELQVLPESDETPRPHRKKGGIYELSKNIKLVVKKAEEIIDIRQYKGGKTTKIGIELTINKYKRLKIIREKVNEELAELDGNTNAESIVGWHSLANDMLVRSGTFLLDKAYSKGVDIRKAKGTQSAAKDMKAQKKGVTLSADEWKVFCESVLKIDEEFEENSSR